MLQGTKLRHYTIMLMGNYLINNVQEIKNKCICCIIVRSFVKYMKFLIARLKTSLIKMYLAITFTPG